MNAKLIGSAGSLEAIRKLIADYLYGSTITLTEIDKNRWSVSNKNGLLRYEVVLKKGRYRCEIETL